MNTKVIYRILLGIACLFLVYACINSVVTPIRFEEQRANRETAVIKKLIALRTAEGEFKLVNGRYTDNLDSLILFLRTAPKKEVLKEGRLSDKQLENGLTENKAAKILERAKVKAKAKNKKGFENDDEMYEYIWANDTEVKENGLAGFRRDTIYTNMIASVYKGEYTEENIDQIIYIPYTDKQKYEVNVNNKYTTSQGINVPLFEVCAHYNTYLADLDDQERVNLIDKEETLMHYPGLKVGDVTQPNNNAGNWE